MAESYSVEAVLSAEDKNFSSVFGKADSAVDLLGSKIRGGLGFMTLGGIGQTAMNLVSKGISLVANNMDAAINRVDTLNQFPKMMEQMGFSAEQSQASIDKLGNSINGLPTSLDEIAASTQSLALLTGNLDMATDLSVALNDAFLASGSSSEEAARGLTQYSQMLSKGKVDQQSWNTLLDTMSPALTQVANEFGFVGQSAKSDLYEALKDGSITFDQFNEKLIEMDGRAADTGEALTGFSKQAEISTKGIKTSMQNIKTAIVKNLANAITEVDKALHIADIFDAIKGKVNEAGKGITGVVSGIVTAMKPSFDYASKIVQDVFGDIGNVVKSFKDAFNKIDFTPFKDAFEQIWENIGELSTSVASILGENADSIANMIAGAASTIMNWVSRAIQIITNVLQGLAPYIKIVIDEAKRVGEAFGEAFSAVMDSIAYLSNSLGGDEAAIKSFGDVVKSVADKLVKFAGFIKEHADTIAKFAAQIPKLVVGFYLLKGAFKAISAVKGFTSLFSGISKVGGVAGGATSKMQQFGNTVLSVGAGVLLCAAGFWVMTQAATQLAAAGGPAIAVFFGMVGAIAALIIVASKLGPSTNAGAIGLLALGAAVILCGVGFSILANAAIKVASAGTAAGVILGVLLGAMIGLVAVVGALGGGLLLAGIGIAIACAGFALLATQSEGVSQILRTLGDVVVDIIGAFADAASQIITAFAPIADTVGQTLQAVSDAFARCFETIPSILDSFAGIVDSVFSGVSSTIESFGTLIDSVFNGISDVITATGDAIRNVLDGISGIFDSIGNAALNAGEGMENVASAIERITALPIMDMSASLGAAATGIGSIASHGAEMEQVGTAMEQVSGGITSAAGGANALAASMAVVSAIFMTLPQLITAAVQKASAGFKMLGSSATAASASVSTSMQSMAQNASRVFTAMAQGLTQLAARTKSSATQIGNSFRTTIQSAFTATVSIVTRLMASFASAISAGGNRAVGIARSISSQIAAAFASGVSSAYNAGVMIGTGLANGLASTAGAVAAQAAHIISLANAAMAAKAKMGSPSKVTYQYGKWYGEGFGNGIKKMFSYVWGASEDLVAIPAMAGAPSRSIRGLNDDYSYGVGASYVIEVPVILEGREVAHVTAPYTQAELATQEMRRSRKEGVR